MPVPKRRTSSTRRDKRRTHKKLTSTALSECPQCHEMKLPHRICANCGSYKGRQVVEVE